MASKSLRWAHLSEEQFDNIHTQLNELRKMFSNTLKSVGFTKIKYRKHHLNFTIERSDKDEFVFIALSLVNDNPREFELNIQKLEFKDPPVPFVEVYKKIITDINEFKASFNKELALIKEKLKVE